MEKGDPISLRIADQTLKILKKEARRLSYESDNDVSYVDLIRQAIEAYIRTLQADIVDPVKLEFFHIPEKAGPLKSLGKGEYRKGPLPVIVASTSDLYVQYQVNGGIKENGQITMAPGVIDSVILDVGDRILLKDQRYPVSNGIWEVVVGCEPMTLGGVWERADDLKADTGLCCVKVLQGKHQGTSFCIDTDGLEIGGDDGSALAFIPFSEQMEKKITLKYAPSETTVSEEPKRPDLTCKRTEIKGELTVNGKPVVVEEVDDGGAFDPQEVIDYFKKQLSDPISKKVARKAQQIIEENSIARRVLTQDEGNLFHYKRDVAAIAYVICRRGAVPDPIIEGDDVTVPCFEIAAFPTVKYKDLRMNRTSIVERMILSTAMSIAKEENYNTIKILQTAAYGRPDQIVSYDTQIEAEHLEAAFTNIVRHDSKVEHLLCNQITFMRLQKATANTETPIQKMLPTQFGNSEQYMYRSATIIQTEQMSDGEVIFTGPAKELGYMPIEDDVGAVPVPQPEKLRAGYMVYQTIGLCVLTDWNVSMIVKRPEPRPVITVSAGDPVEMGKQIAKHVRNAVDQFKLEDTLRPKVKKPKQPTKRKAPAKKRKKKD